MTQETDVPDSVTYREVQEILRTFQASGWTGLTLEVRGMTITVGKNGPPAVAQAAPAKVQESHVPAPTVPERGFPATPAGASATPAAASPAPPPPSAPLDTTGLTAVRSPAVGAFWVAPAPGQPPFVEVGQSVAEGDQMAIVEVMKLMNPVLSSAAGEVVAVAATDAEMVEYEQVLFWVRPADG
jgi:acetyl-CoA carboxylase biotin carboxyl carrier protein